MSSIKTVGIILCIQLVWVLVYGIQSELLRKKGPVNQNKRQNGDKESKGRYEVFKMKNKNYFFQKANSSRKSHNQSVSLKGILLIGGERAPFSIEIYHTDEKQHNHLLNVSLHERRSYQISELLNDQTVIICGGSDPINNKPLCTCEILDLSTETISNAKEHMNECRFRAASAVIHGILYVCGGRNGSKAVLSSCERYKSGYWKYVASMNTARFEQVMVAFYDHLYAIGGRNGNFRMVDTVDQYSLIKNEWFLMKSTHLKRQLPSAAVIHDLLVVCGGRDGHSYLNPSCEQYDPKNDTWYSFAKMKARRFGFTMVTAGDRLFALGGLPQIRSVEMYDEKKGKWRILGKELIKKRWSHSAVVVP